MLIRVHATSVNFADIKVRRGEHHGGQKPPYTPGIDLMGTIEKLGSNVHNLQVGQRVIAFPIGGSYSQYAIANENLTFPISDYLDSNIAAASPTVSFTAYNLLAEIAKIQRGETVLIHSAAGGIGTTASQIAKILGAKKVIGTVSSDEKISISKVMGSDEVINYRKDDFVDRVLETTNGRGVDIILDSIGGKIFNDSLRCLAQFGRIVNFGNSSGQPGTVETTNVHSSCRSVLGYSFGTVKKYSPERVAETATKVVPLLEKGQINMHIGETFPLDEAKKAQELMENRKTQGKILLMPDQD